MGVALGYALLGYDSLARGLDKLEVNEAALAADLDGAWEVLAEPIQTVMRRYGLPNPYEQLKELTRGKAITREAIAGASSPRCELPAAEKRAPAGDDAGQLHRPGGRRWPRAIWQLSGRWTSPPQLAARRSAQRLDAVRRPRPRAGALPGAPGAATPARIFDFCAAIVDATKDLVCAFKPQIAYFAAQRAEDQLERLMAHIRRVAPDVPVILDAKRGDIGATAEQYAREAFERYQRRRGDAVAVHGLRFDRALPALRRQGR